MSDKQQTNKAVQDSLPPNATPFPYSNYPPATEVDTIDLVELFQTIWRYWWLVVVSVILCLAAAGLFLQINPKSYSSTTVFETYEILGNNSFIKRINDKNVFVTRDFIKIFLEQEGLTPLILADLYDPTTDTYNLQNDLLSPDEFAASLLIGDAKNPTFEFHTEKSSGLSSLTVHFRDPDLAASLANAGLRWVKDYSFSQEIIDLQRKIDDLDQILSKLELAKINEFNPPETDTSSSISLSVLANLQQRLIDRQIELGVLEKTQSSAPSITGMKIEIALLEAKLFELNNQRNSLSIRYERESEELTKLKIEFARDQSRLEQLRSGKLPYIRVIDRAIPPENPSKPNVRLIIALSLVVGLFGGVFLIFAVEFIRKTRERFREIAS